MTHQYYQYQRNVLRNQIKDLHKQMDKLDEQYAQSVEREVARRGITPGTSITIFHQPAIFRKIMTKGDTIFAAVQVILESGFPSPHNRHVPIYSADDIKLRYDIDSDDLCNKG